MTQNQKYDMFANHFANDIFVTDCLKRSEISKETINSYVNKYIKKINYIAKKSVEEFIESI